MELTDLRDALLEAVDNPARVRALAESLPRSELREILTCWALTGYSISVNGMIGGYPDAVAVFDPNLVHCGRLDSQGADTKHFEDALALVNWVYQWREDYTSPVEFYCFDHRPAWPVMKAAIAYTHTAPESERIGEVGSSSFTLVK